MIRNYVFQVLILTILLGLLGCEADQHNNSDEDNFKENIRKGPLIKKYLRNVAMLNFAGNTKNVVFLVPEKGCVKCVTTIHNYLMEKVRSSDTENIYLVLYNRFSEDNSRYFFGEICESVHCVNDPKQQVLKYGFNTFFPYIILMNGDLPVQIKHSSPQSVNSLVDLSDEYLRD